MSLRYEVAVAFKFDGNPVAGKSVWQLDERTSSSSLPNVAPTIFSVRGEAIQIPLAGKRTLFVLRRSRGSFTSSQYGSFVHQCVSQAQPGMAEVEALRSFSGGCDVFSQPMITLHQDDDDATHLVVVPYDTRNPEPGSRVSELKIRVTVTQEPLTTGIAKTYPWISELPLPEVLPGYKPGHGLEIIDPKIIYRLDFTPDP